MKVNLLTFGTALAVAIPLCFAGAANAERPENAGCWGAVTAEFAPLGEHARSFDTPREGVGNVSNQSGRNPDASFGQDSVGDHGAVQGAMAFGGSENLPDKCTALVPD